MARKRIQVALNEEQAREVENAAKNKALSLSSYIRSVLMEKINENKKVTKNER